MARTKRQAMQRYYNMNPEKVISFGNTFRANTRAKFCTRHARITASATRGSKLYKCKRNSSSWARKR